MRRQQEDRKPLEVLKECREACIKQLEVAQQELATAKARADYCAVEASRLDHLLYHYNYAIGLITAQSPAASGDTLNGVNNG